MIRVHATAVAKAQRAVLLLGPPGSGKSDLALRLIDRGWVLVADDQVELTRDGETLRAAAPATIVGLIEARGVGLLRRATVGGVPVAMAFDLSATPDRLPEPQARAIGGIALPCLALAPFEASAPLKVEAALTLWGNGVDSVSVDEAVPLQDAATPALVVTGLSGAGKSTVLKALEDLGFEVVDNLPLALFDRLLEPGEASALPRRLALGIDSRTRGFDAEAIAARVRALRGEGVDVRLLFIDCGSDELMRRFSETRRRHPLALDRPAADGIAAERALLDPLRRWADVVIDTSDFRAADLRAHIADRFDAGAGHAPTLTCLSFGFARGLPRDADLVFDMRFLANPHWDVTLRPLTGQDPAVAAFVAADPAYAPAVDRIADLLLTLLPGYGAEGKAYLTIAVGCTGGRHRSVAVAHELHARLSAAGHAPLLVHRDVASIGNDAAILTVDPIRGEGSAA